MTSPPQDITLDPREVGDDISRLMPALDASMRATREVLANGITLADNIKAYIRQLTITVPGDWVPASFAAGWTNSVPPNQTLETRKCEDGRVIWRGRASFPGGVPPALGANITSVPLDWAPPAREVFLCFATGGAAVIEVTSAGLVNYAAPAIGVAYDNIAFGGAVEWDAADRRPSIWTTPFTILLPARWRPAYVLVLSITQAVAISYVATGGHVVTWTHYITSGGERHVEIKKIRGLAPGQTYSVTVAIFPE